MDGDSRPGYFRSALFHWANLGWLGSSAIAALAAVDHSSPVPAMAMVGAELVYLGLMPLIPGFRRRVERKLADQRREAAAKDADQLLQELAPSQREHFFALRDLKDKIMENYRRLNSSGLMLLSSEQRIDQLPSSFLRLLSTLNAYRKNLSGANRAEVEREIHELTSDSARTEGPERVREVQQKRLEILKKRLARFDQAAEHRELMSHQLASIEDILRLLHEQSIGMRDPEIVSRQLDTVAAEVESTESTVRELEEFLTFDDPAVLPHAEPQRVR